MYRHGLGDCFLLSFPRSGRNVQPFHLLIDCGVIVGTKGAADKMKQVAKDIAAATNKHLDLLVVTHEHADHVSGFLQAANEFTRFTVGEVWLGWTEDPEDPVARKLRNERGRKATALRTALSKVEQHLASAGHDPRAQRMKDLALEAGNVLGFFDLEAPDGSSVADAMDWLRNLGAKFRRPGEPPLTLEGVEGVRVFVLGPPTDLKKLLKNLPTKTGKETYGVGDLAALSVATDAFCAARGLHAADSKEKSDDSHQPFGLQMQVTPEQAQADLFFQRHYGFGPDNQDAWRRIDFEWMAAAGEFALNLDSDTNNTSLVLAIELPDGRVLLFPGDAQVGNWESWHDLTWMDTGDKKVTAQDLLGRTVLYKVGHHGSHNATLREKGLEMMTHPELVAMVPIDEKVAHHVKHWNQMPFGPLMKRLAEKTHGRLLRADVEEAKTLPPKDATPAEEKRFKEFLGRVEFSGATVNEEGGRSLYVDYTIPL
jgi:hypothetical protein